MSVTRVNGGALPFVATGRALAFYTVTKTGVHTGSSAVDSDFEKIVRAIETVASVEILGTPASDTFRVAISGAAPAANTTAGSLEGICNAAVAGTTVASYTF